MIVSNLLRLWQGGGVGNLHLWPERVIEGGAEGDEIMLQGDCFLGRVLDSSHTWTMVGSQGEDVVQDGMLDISNVKYGLFHESSK